MDEAVSKSQRFWKSRERGPGPCSPRRVPCHLQRGQSDALRGESLALSYACGGRDTETQDHTLVSSSSGPHC